MNCVKMMALVGTVFAVTTASALTVKIDNKECKTKPGEVVSLKKNQSLQITFDVAPGTGYSWFLSKKPLPYLTLKSEGTQQKPGHHAIGGASSIKIFDFIANKGKGTGTIVFENKRPWEKANPVTESISYEVK